MSDDPYKAPETKGETREHSELMTSRRLPASRLPSLWIGIGVLGMIAIGVASSDGLPIDVIGFGLGLALLLLSAVGLTLNWGAMIPCMFLGAGAFAAMTNPISSSHEEAAWKDIGVPLTGAICGAIVGVILDYRRKSGEHERRK